MLAPTKALAKEFGLQALVDHDFLVTRLFPPELTEGKSVIVLAQSKDVIDEYRRLKRTKLEAAASGRLSEVEYELARVFGRLLSYSEEAIERLIDKNRASNQE